MRVATDTVDITPRGTFYMEGYIHPVRKEPALGVHDAPHAVLLLLGQGQKEVLFVSLDVCIVSEEGTRELRNQLCELMGLESSHIVISSIHSHSCANGFEGEDGLIKAKSPGYVSMVSGLVVEAATTLRSKAVDTTAEILRTHVDGWYSNRNDKERPFDDEAYVLRFRAEDGKVVGALLNFNCHATVVGPLNRLLTADVIGGVRQELSEWIGVTPYTFTGASADLGNRQYRQGNDFAELRRISNGIAGEVMRDAFVPVKLQTPTVGVFDYEVSYDNRDFYPEYQRQLDEVMVILAGKLTFDEKKLADTEKACLEGQLKCRQTDFSIHMVVINLGPVVLVTFPGELASDLGMVIKGMFPGKDAMVVGYANDYQGYFVPAGDFGGTSYESYVTKMPKGWIERALEDFKEQL